MKNLKIYVIIICFLISTSCQKEIKKDVLVFFNKISDEVYEEDNDTLNLKIEIDEIYHQDIYIKLDIIYNNITYDYTYNFVNENTIIDHEIEILTHDFLIIPKGEKFTSISFNIKDDKFIEGDETLAINISDVYNADFISSKSKYKCIIKSGDGITFGKCNLNFEGKNYSTDQMTTFFGKTACIYYIYQIKAQFETSHKLIFNFRPFPELNNVYQYTTNYCPEPEKAQGGILVGQEYYKIRNGEIRITHLDTIQKQLNLTFDGITTINGYKLYGDMEIDMYDFFELEPSWY